MSECMRLFELVNEFANAKADYQKSQEIAQQIRQILVTFKNLVNSSDYGGSSLLHKLVSESSRYYIKLKGNPHHEFVNNQFALGYDLIDLIISLGANVNTPSLVGRSPLMDASDPHVIRTLVNAGADVYY